MTQPLLQDESPNNEQALVSPALNGQGRAENASQMTMLEHLEELRRRIVTAVISLVAGIVIAFSMVTPAMNILKILAPADSHFIQLTPGEVFMSAFRLATFMGIALASPVMLYQLLRFILPGLKPKESRFLLWMVLGGAVLFLGGMVFGYYAVLPPTLEWLLGFGAEVAEVNMSIGRFVEFCTGMILLCGVLFELPVLLFLLSFTNLVNSRQLSSQWRLATIIIFVASAILTPSQDPLTLTVVGGALMALYFLSVVSIRLCGR
jgi:sec-independent protein translocase protein TatC